MNLTESNLVHSDVLTPFEKLVVALRPYKEGNDVPSDLTLSLPGFSMRFKGSIIVKLIIKI